MKLGTAGFTAALAIHRMEQNGQTPSNGPVVVTGATGGVGSLAISMLAGRGYEVAALSGKADADDYLRDIGAAQVLRRQDLTSARSRWRGCSGPAPSTAWAASAHLAHAHHRLLGQHRQRRARGRRANSTPPSCRSSCAA